MFQGDKADLGTQNNDVAPADWGAQGLSRPSTDSALVPDVSAPRRIHGKARQPTRGTRSKFRAGRLMRTNNTQGE